MLQPLMLRLTRKAAAFAAAIDCLTSHLSQAGKNFWNVPAEFESTVTAALRLGPIKASHCNLPLPRIAQSEKQVFLFVPNTTKSQPFACPWGGHWYTG